MGPIKERILSKIEREFLQLHAAKTGPCGCEGHTEWIVSPKLVCAISEVREDGSGSCFPFITVNCDGCHQVRFFEAVPLL